MLPEALSAVGYRTAAWVSNAHLTPRFGFGQGYDDYHFLTKPVPPGSMPATDRQGLAFTLDALAVAPSARSSSGSI